MAMNRAAVFLIAAATLLIGGAVLHVTAAPPPAAQTPSTSPLPSESAIAPSAPATAQALQPAQMQRMYELLYLLRHKERGPKADLWDRWDQFDQWCDAIRQVVEIGKPAVPYLIAELDSTKSEFCMRNVAFTLRAIGDPRAVPALLRAMPRCAFASNDMGVPIINPQLAQFMVKNSVEGHAPQVPDSAKRATSASLFFYYHRPIVEIDAALKKLTGHNEGETHIRTNPFGKTETEQQVVRDVYGATATRWQKWWDQNHTKLVSDQELATVQLPPAQGEAIEAAGKAKFGDLTGADVPLEPLGIDRLLTRFSRISRAVNQQDGKAAGDAVAGALKDYQAVAQQEAERQAHGNPPPVVGDVLVVAQLPEKRVALLKDMQKAVQDGDWPKARSSDAKLSEMGPGIFTFTAGTPPATTPVAAPVTTPPTTPASR